MNITVIPEIAIVDADTMICLDIGRGHIVNYTLDFGDGSTESGQYSHASEDSVHCHSHVYGLGLFVFTATLRQVLIFLV